MLEIVFVFTVIGVVALFAVRSFYRTISGKNQGCGCGAGCPISGSCKAFGTRQL
ncbi:MAG: hypothetical protein JRI33_03215 [Deltaproteobacteria bacterium]|nr:hypothetical protein [Deltaproteobacteria bacterium]